MILAVAWLLGVLFWCAVWGGIGGAVGSGKGRTGAGIVLGVVLGFIGVIIVAVLPPSQEVELEREARLVRAIQGSQTSATNRASELTAMSSGTGAAVSSPPRQELIAEAINRDPTLANPHDPAALKRLNAAVEDLTVEYRTRTELQMVMALQPSASGAPDAAVDSESDLGLASNPATDHDTLRRLIHSDDVAVAVAAARNPSLPMWLARRTEWESDSPVVKAVIGQVLSERSG